MISWIHLTFHVTSVPPYLTDIEYSFQINTFISKETKNPQGDKITEKKKERKGKKKDRNNSKSCIIIFIGIRGTVHSKRRSD